MNAAVVDRAEQQIVVVVAALCLYFSGFLYVFGLVDAFVRSIQDDMMVDLIFDGKNRVV